MLISVPLLKFAYYYIHINLPLKTLYLLKKMHQNPLGSFKDLSVHRDRQRKATWFYTTFDAHFIGNDIVINMEVWLPWNNDPTKQLRLRIRDFQSNLAHHWSEVFLEIRHQFHTSILLSNNLKPRKRCVFWIYVMLF
jgi:hypothetical protein